MNLTREQVEGWKMNNGAMSPNEFAALCDLALAALSEKAPPLPEAPEHLKRLADRVHQGDGMTLKEREMARAVILSFATPHELRDLGHKMLAASPSMLRWYAEQLASRLGCSGPFSCGSAMRQEPANE